MREVCEGGGGILRDHDFEGGGGGTVFKYHILLTVISVGLTVCSEAVCDTNRTSVRHLANNPQTILPVQLVRCLIIVQCLIIILDIFSS